MPVTKSNKKPVSQQKREEIREAVGSIPGLIIEHVSFDQNNSMDEDSGGNIHNKKYMLSDAKHREHRKKRRTMLVGVGIVVFALATLWVVNMKSFFFDSRHSLSTEENLLGIIKNDFNNTVGLLGERPSIVSSTVKTLEEETLKAALLAGLATVSTTTSSTLDIMVATSTTSTIVTAESSTSTTSTEPHFPVAENTTTTTSTP